MIEDEIIGRLEARNAELEQMVAVLMRHEARDDTIKVQRARIAELEAVLKPFADAADDFISEKHDMTRAIVSLGDLRAAAAALKEAGDE